MSSQNVRYTSDNLPPLTEQDRADLRALAELPDSEIDTVDVPELSAERWSHAVRNPYLSRLQNGYDPETVRIDADILEWLRRDAAGADSHANTILRREMLAEQERKASETGNLQPC